MRVGLPAASAAIASAIAAEVLRHLALAIGTFSIARANPRAPVNQMIVNLRGLLGYGAALAGVGIKPFSSASEPAILFIAHAIGLVVLVVAVCLAAVAVLRATRSGSAPVRLVFIRGHLVEAALSFALSCNSRATAPGHGSKTCLSLLS